jgi:hypothetical protein
VATNALCNWRWERKSVQLSGHVYRRVDCDTMMGASECWCVCRGNNWGWRVDRCTGWVLYVQGTLGRENVHRRTVTLDLITWEQVR